MKNEFYKSFLDELNLSYTNETFSSDYDTEVLWFPENSSLFIRGSDSLLDWIFNLLFFPMQPIGFHYGFWLKAIKLIQRLEEESIIPTTVVGHSAGGAIAQMVAFYFDCEAYSLASPKTSTLKNEGFREWANEKLVIIIQENDIISKLPPWLLHHPVNPLILDSKDYKTFSHHLIAFE